MTTRSRLLFSGVVGALVLIGAIGLTTGADKDKAPGHRFLKAGWKSGGPAIFLPQMNTDESDVVFLL
jgi:hypothetical protein